MAKKNIFGKAKTKTTSKAKKDEKRTIKITGKEFAESLKTFAETTKKMKELKSECDLAKGIVSEKAKEKYAEIYEEEGINIGSFNIEADNGSTTMWLPTKKYIKIDEDDVESLTEKYGEDIVEETTEYKFDDKLLDKYMDKISDLLMNCDDIDDKDKENLIVATSKFTIEKEALDKCAKYAKDSESTISEVLEDLNYVSQIKGAKSN